MKIADVKFGYYPNAATKAVTFSYDDGFAEDARLIGILNRHNMKGTFHLNSKFLGMDGHIKAEKVKELYRGHEVSVHSYSHPYLNHIPDARVCREIIEDRSNLEGLTGSIVNGMSYPYGAFSEDNIKTLRNLGIVYSRTCVATRKFDIPEDFMKWHPTCHHRENLSEMAEKFIKIDTDQLIKYSRGNMPLLYVWGHSRDFERDGNWNVIDEFCDFIGQCREGIWFATNIEIYYYIQALKALVFSSDLTMVYNPGGISVWIGVGGKPTEIKPDERKILTV